MKEIKREWQRISAEAWDYGRNWDGTESWTVLARAKGTAGNMAGYAYCREVHSLNGEVELFYLSDAEVVA
jgi:hypothetical protein